MFNICVKTTGNGSSRYFHFLKKSIFAVFFMVIAMLTASCEKTAAVSGDDNPDNPPGEGVSLSESGMYVGIIGFNEELTEKEIGLLTKDNKGTFRNFIDDLPKDASTALYFAVENGLDRLTKNITYPADLVDVSIVTFTDGVDNASTMLNKAYATKEEYRNYLQSRIGSTDFINDVKLSAYTIGVQLGATDDMDEEEFNANIESLSSGRDYMHDLKTMEEVNDVFQTIAASLNKESTSQKIVFKVNGGEDD
ncbi:MAG: hypothetical protein LBV41_00005, partial [Cytophagaceae bacterium]|nr:hypothetical protein [Cytophagaceae bacterium]